MYHQINPTEIFREREVVLLKEAENRRLLWLLWTKGSTLKARSTLIVVAAVVDLLVVLLVGGLASPRANASVLLVVNSLADQADANTADGSCIALNGSCTLRAAIQQANATPGADVIQFSISGSEVQTIMPSSPLPPITEQVTIDGYSQTGAFPNTLAKGTNAAPKIELDGTNLTNAIGLELQGSSGSVIRGLVINRFSTGIALDGGTAANHIEGNFIGTDSSGTLDRGNSGNGVFLNGTSGNVIGGTTPAARNLISGNDQIGILLFGAGGNKVIGNLVGTAASGTAPLGNGQFGVGLADGFVSGNRIGDGTSAGSNTIAFNGTGIGASGESTLRNPISHNSIFSNVGLGIDLLTDTFLGVTPNDPGDADAGANGLQNFPVITSAKSSSATTIAGKLNSTRRSTFTIEFFSNPSFTDEGKKFIGKKTVTTDRSGKATFVFKPARKVPVGQAITATATDGSGNTSEFSAPRQVAKG